MVLNSTKKEKRYSNVREYLELYRALTTECQNHRSKGHRVNFDWLWPKARKSQRRLTNDFNVTVRRHVINNFISETYFVRGFPATPILRHLPLDPACLLFLKSLFPFPSFLFHPHLRYFSQFPPPSRNPLLP